LSRRPFANGRQGHRGRQPSGGQGHRRGQPSENRARSTQSPEDEHPRLTRRQVNRPQTDDEFVAEYEPLSPGEQDRRLHLIDLDPADLSRRLLRLGRTQSEITRVLEDRAKPLLERNSPNVQRNPSARTSPNVQRDSDGTSDQELRSVKSEFTPSPPPSPLPQNMAGEEQGAQPPWLKAIIQSNKDREEANTKALTNCLKDLVIALNQNKTENKPIAQLEDVRPIKPEDIYEFKPSDSPDDCEYFLFIERIKDYVAQYHEDRVRPSLVSCLKNSRAKQWYASLSEEDKRKLRTSTTEWKDMLERDFGIKSARARFLASKEEFSFAQNRPVLQYFEAKLTWLKISGIVDQNVLAIEIREGLQDPEYRAAVRLPLEAKLAWLRSELVDTEADSRALWLKHSRPQRSLPMPTRLPPGQPFYQPPNPVAAPHQVQQPPMRRRGRGFRGQFGTGGFRSRGRYQSFGTRRDTPPAPATSAPVTRAQGERLAITAGEAIAPPRPCRFCGGSHWDRECARFPPPTTVPAFYTYDQMESPDDYYYDETQYEAMQTAAYNVSMYHHQEEDGYYYYPEDEITENVTK
jgi:hypothetical protein